MSWENAGDYRAIIGGCYFRDVPRIVSCNGNPFVTVKRNSSNNSIVVDVDITDADGVLISEIRNGEIQLNKADSFRVLNDEMRSSVVETKTGMIMYDFGRYSEGKGIDFQCSIITHLPNGLPFFLHPNRIRIGSPHILKPHLTSLKLTTHRGALGPALFIDLLGVGKNEEIMHVPPAPMIGRGGVVTNSVINKSDMSNKEMAVLMMYGENNQAGNISLRGPCYFLDLAFENFEIGLAITCAVQK
jgi:hypothetical protein